jgi:hypothetical protein
MLFAPPPPLPAEKVEELAQYSRTLHDYTLHLWTESRRLAEEKTHRTSKGRRAQQRFSQEYSGSSEESSDDASPTARRGSDSSHMSTSGSCSDVSEAEGHGTARGTSRTRAGSSTPERERQRKHRRTDGSSADLRARMAAVTL